MKKSFFQLALILPAILLAFSCGNSASDDLQHTDTDTLVVDDTEDDAMDFTLPSPLQIAAMFKQAGLPYQANITNNPENVNNYVTKYNQKLNFGVYTADMAYCVLNKQNQQAIYYLKNLGQLSEKLWMSNIFHSVDVLSRFEKNIGSEDSLAAIISDMQLIMDNYLEENGVGSNGSIIFAGAWIESMFIGSKVVEKSDNAKLISRLAEQAIVLETLVKLLEKNNAEEAEELIKDLKNLQKHFAHFLQAEEAAEESDEDIEVNYTFTKDEMNALMKDIEVLRNKIIN